MSKPKPVNYRTALALMRKRDGATAEEGFGLLRHMAAECVDELIVEFKNEEDHGLRCWLLELIGYARSPKALPLFRECLIGSDVSLRSWAMYGLDKLDTKEAHLILWEAKSHHFSSEEETRQFQDMLNSLRANKTPTPNPE